MDRVPTPPRPPLLLFLTRCLWFGTLRGALYGMACGAGYGVLFLLIGALYVTPYGALFLPIGALFGALIGLVFGAAAGMIDGLLYGLLLYFSTNRFATALDQRALFARQRIFRGFIAGFSFLVCGIGGYIYYYGAGPLKLIQLYSRGMVNNQSIFFIIIPSLVAGICGYFMTGHMLQWYLNSLVFEAQVPTVSADQG